MRCLTCPWPSPARYRARSTGSGGQDPVPTVGQLPAPSQDLLIHLGQVAPTQHGTEGEEAIVLSEPQPAGDDAAQDLRGATLDGEFGRDHGGVAKPLLERCMVGGLGG